MHCMLSNDRLGKSYHQQMQNGEGTPSHSPRGIASGAKGDPHLDARSGWGQEAGDGFPPLSLRRHTPTLPLNWSSC